MIFDGIVLWLECTPNRHKKVDNTYKRSTHISTSSLMDHGTSPLILQN
jgi:hypothetical protein